MCHGVLGTHPCSAGVKVCYLPDADTARPCQPVELGAFRLWLFISGEKVITLRNRIIIIMENNNIFHRSKCSRALEQNVMNSLIRSPSFKLAVTEGFAPCFVSWLGIGMLWELNVIPAQGRSFIKPAGMSRLFLTPRLL